MSINTTQFRELVVRPTLQYLDTEIKYSEEAEDLLILTAAHESNMGEYLKQINGPALGVYQMEPATLIDIWDNYLDHRQELASTVEVLCEGLHYWEPEGLITNLMYATAMARIHYYRVPEALPKKQEYDTEDSYVWALAEYAKEHWNTHLGRATVTDYYRAYVRHNKVVV